MESCAAVKTELETASDPVEETNLELLPTSLKSCNSNTCYNKFLSYFNLPLLPPNQTLKSFLEHLKEQKFNNNITLSVNHSLNETHIYLPNDYSLLPNHTIIEQFLLTKYLNLPIRTTHFNTLNFDNNLNTVPYTTESQSSNEYEYKSITRNIASLNVNGLL